jgi:hypothetical protein
MREPARKIKKSAVKNIVRFAPIKSNGGKSILVESILEAKYCLHLEFDPSVLSYFPQPKTFYLSHDDGLTKYTPDFEVCKEGDIVVYTEVKPKRRAQSAHYEDIFNRLELELLDTNAGFNLVNEFDIETRPLLSNYEKLYRFRKRPEIDHQQLFYFASIYNSKLILKDLICLVEKEVSLKQVYSWIATDYLKFDIHSVELSIDSEVWFDV